MIDLETTGLNPWRHDRIAEIAIVGVDEGGEITSEWCTLVNPLRDLGPQRIHGIRAVDARRAPTFARIAGQIVERLRGRVLVAHNAAFDGPFLAHQFRRIGHPVPITKDANLCTMELAATFLPGSGRSLAACCATAGVPLENAHCALDDARAAALLFGHYLRAAGSPPPWADRLAAAESAAWPTLKNPDLDEVRRPQTATTPEHFLSRLVDRLPRVNAPAAADAYLSLLDRALVDRQISATESDALVAAARALDLSRPEVIELHTGYLDELAHAALMNEGLVSAAERADLDQVAVLLGLSPESIEDALSPGAHRVIPSPRSRFALRPGDTVAFTGDTVPPRESWERRAREAGLDVAATVTAETRLLVAADIDTMSVKARKAMLYGVPVVDLQTFEEMVRTVLGVTP